MALLETATGAALGVGTELLLSKWRQKQQREQQQKLQDMQIKGQKEMTEFNANINKNNALEVWEKTGPVGLVKEYNKAGLSTGLMYGGSGGGGQTISSPTGTVTGATANEPDTGMGVQNGIAAAAANASIDLAKAQADKARAEAAKISGADTEESKSRTSLNIQNEQNAAITGNILKYEEAIREIDKNIATGTQEQVITNIANAGKKLEGEAESAMNAGKLSKEAYADTLKQIKQTTTEQQLRMSLQKADLIKKGVETESIKAGIAKISKDIQELDRMDDARWREWGQKEKERFIREQLLELQKAGVEFNTSDAAKTRQLIGIFTDILGSSRGGGGPVPVTGFGGGQ